MLSHRFICPYVPLQRDGRQGIIYREWAPAARAASLVGDFNRWDADANPCVKDDFVSESVALRVRPSLSHHYD